jgi:hypothetical protein
MSNGFRLAGSRAHRHERSSLERKRRVSTSRDQTTREARRLTLLPDLRREEALVPFHLIRVTAQAACCRHDCWGSKGQGQGRKAMKQISSKARTVDGARAYGRMRLALSTSLDPFLSLHLFVRSVGARLVADSLKLLPASDSKSPHGHPMPERPLLDRLSESQVGSVCYRSMLRFTCWLFSRAVCASPPLSAPVLAPSQTLPRPPSLPPGILCIIFDHFPQLLQSLRTRHASSRLGQLLPRLPRLPPLGPRPPLHTSPSPGRLRQRTLRLSLARTFQVRR